MQWSKRFVKSLISETAIKERMIIYEKEKYYKNDSRYFNVNIDAIRIFKNIYRSIIT